MKPFTRILLLIAALSTSLLAQTAAAKEPSATAGSSTESVRGSQPAPKAKPPITDSGLHREDLTLEEMQAYHN